MAKWAMLLGVYVCLFHHGDKCRNVTPHLCGSGTQFSVKLASKFYQQTETEGNQLSYSEFKEYTPVADKQNTQALLQGQPNNEVPCLHRRQVICSYAPINKSVLISVNFHYLRLTRGEKRRDH